MSSGKGLHELASAVLGIDVNSIYAIAGKWLTSDSQYEKWFIRCYIAVFYPCLLYTSIQGLWLEEFGSSDSGEM